MLRIIPQPRCLPLSWPHRPSKDPRDFRQPGAGARLLRAIEMPEFTCLCPMTGQPDFATLVLDYVPDQRNVELKA